MGIIMKHSKKRPDIIITNGEHRSALSITRALGRNKLDVWVSGNHKKSPSFFSKYAKEYFVYPQIKSNSNCALNVLIQKVKKYRPKVFMPILDDALQVYYRNQKQFDLYTSIIPLVKYNEFTYLNTKENYIELAKKKKIDIPHSSVIDKYSELKTIIKDINFPCIIKPNVGNGSQGVSLISSKNELHKKFRELKNQKSTITFNPEKIIIQEYIPNTLSYFNVLLSNGKIIAKQQLKILKTYPPICGGPALSVSILDNKLDEIGIEVLKKTKVKNGALNIQFIFDKTNNKYRLLEINSRIWGSIQSSIDTGVNFPYLLYKIAIGEKVKPVKNYMINKKVKHLTSLIKSSIEQKNYYNLFELLKIINSKSEFNLGDLKPHIIELINETYDYIKKNN